MSSSISFSRMFNPRLKTILKKTLRAPKRDNARSHSSDLIHLLHILLHSLSLSALGDPGRCGAPRLGLFMEFLGKIRRVGQAWTVRWRNPKLMRCVGLGD